MREKNGNFLNTNLQITLYIFQIHGCVIYRMQLIYTKCIKIKNLLDLSFIIMYFRL